MGYSRKCGFYHTIRMLVDALKLSPAAVSMRTIPGGLRLTMTLNKMQLITFVRNCKNVGMQLVSPEQPQPEQSLFNGSATDSVFILRNFSSGAGNRFPFLEIISSLYCLQKCSFCSIFSFLLIYRGRNYICRLMQLSLLF
jgi:hypothetical protein